MNILNDKFKFVLPEKQTNGGKIMEDLKRTLHTFGFWFLIFFMCGAVVGGYSSYLFQKQQLDDAVKVGGVVMGDKVYEIKERLYVRN
jgi:hypothetical protein